jgi:hypothetical protein
MGLVAGGLWGRKGSWVVPIAAIAWPVLLIGDDVDSGVAFFVGAGLLAAANAAVGVALALGLRWLGGSIARATHERPAP